MITTDEIWLAQQWLRSIPADKVNSVCEWAREHFVPADGARSSRYEPEISPWSCPVIEHVNDGVTQTCTLIKPTQTSGSLAGEIIIAFAIANWSSGNVGYFWQNDLASDARWLKRVEKTLQKCKPVMERFGNDRFKWQRGLVLFDHLNFEMKGVRSDRNVASDSFRLVVNEELHDVEGGWEPGRLQQVYGRQTAYWNKIAFNISNAGFVGSDLHKAFMAGTQQHWEIKCPGCGLYHEMRCRWEPGKPELGGLRYDATGCRLSDETYNYPKLQPTIFYQFPCGHTIKDDVTIRRSLSKFGRYSEPKNTGALFCHRSYTYEMVSCDFVPFIDIIARKHAALRSLKHGDYKPYFDFLREVECRFVDVGRDRPAPERVEIISSERKKNREGLPNRALRTAFADWQRGRDGDSPHFWLLIQDWMESGDSLILHESRVDTEGELVATLTEHEVKPICTVVDSSWDATRIYAMCLRRGFNAVKADDKMYWRWEDGSERFYCEPRPLCMVANAAPSQPDDPSSEPDFWLYSKYVSMERLVYLRQSKEIKYEIPIDVSTDFIEQFDSWKVEVIRMKDGQSKMKWRQTRDDDHLFQCAAGILPVVDLMGIFTGMGVSIPTVEKEAEAEVVTV